MFNSLSTSPSAASRSSRLLYDSSLPDSTRALATTPANGGS